ncbi:acyl-CoA dehydrogenase family protein [Kitasatospora sp. NPDC059673]|uniref:acyl-CoA dehydrogenase family protein n=1 Tax=Kitasatospora sp. NPDC059673 TaxID=3346901 RepID=UPI00367981EB
MDLRTDPVQRRLAEAVDAALSRTGDPYAELAAIGVPELSLPARLGGYGLGLGADVVVNLRLGHHLQPLPAGRETLFALGLLTAEQLPDGLLEQVLKGAAHVVTIGVHDRPTLRADQAGGLWGESGPLPSGEPALAVVRATAPGGVPRWYVVRPDPADEPAGDGSLLGVPGRTVRFAGTRATEIEVPDELLRSELDAARIRQAAVLLGLADRAVAATRTHVNRRTQFGRPLVELQTVAHRLARLVGLADGWRLLVHEAAWRHDLGEPCTGEAAQALAAAAEHALTATRLCIQLHGARGMLAHSTAATAYRLASLEATRMGPPARLWAEAGRAHLAAGRAAPGLTG